MFQQLCQNSNPEQLIEELANEYVSMRNHFHDQLKSLLNGFQQIIQKGSNTENTIQRVRIEKLNLNESCPECYAIQYSKQKKTSPEKTDENGEQTYCFCGQPESGKMVACDNIHV